MASFFIDSVPVQGIERVTDVIESEVRSIVSVEFSYGSDGEIDVVKVKTTEKAGLVGGLKVVRERE